MIIYETDFFRCKAQVQQLVINKQHNKQQIEGTMQSPYPSIILLKL